VIRINSITLLSVILFLFSTLAGAAQDLIPTTRVSKGKLIAPELNEVSGIIASDANPGSFWMHNDSGDKARIFLVDSSANLLQIVNLEGIIAIDMEEIGKFKRDGKNYLVLGDIGDNRGLRKDIRLYILEEPVREQSGKKEILIKSSQIQTIILHHDGKARDAEAFFIDPLDNRFYLISKREFKSIVYSADIFQEVEKHTLKPVITLPFTFVTAADISPAGDAILIKNLTNIYYWSRPFNESIQHSLSKPYKRLAYQQEPQGEAITFDQFGKTFFTVSERPFGLDSYLYQYNFSKPKN